MKREFPPAITYIFVALMSVAVLATQTTIPFLIKQLGGEIGVVGLVVAWGSFWYVVAGLSLGGISHHLGPRRVMVGTLAICAALTLLMTRVVAMWQLYALVTLYYMAISVYWAATEHATTGLHSHLSLVQSTALFCVTFSIGNYVGILASTFLQGKTLVIPLLVSVTLYLVVMAMVWAIMSPTAGFPQSSESAVDAFPQEARERLRYLLVGTRTGLVAVYGPYALMMYFLPRYLWEHHYYTKPAAGIITGMGLIAMGLVFAAHSRWQGWKYNLATVRTAPFVSAVGLVVIAATADPYVVSVGAIIIGICAGTVYTHNLNYSLEEPGRRARNAGVHEAMVGTAFMLPPALSGLSANWTKAPEAIFWVGAGLTVLIGIGQNVALTVCRKPTEKKQE